MTYIGIDPGKSGALAMIDGDIAFAIPFDETKYIAELQTVDPRQAAACLEYVHAMPNQGTRSMFSFGQNYGWLQGVLTVLRIPYELVAPRKWKGAFSVTGDKNSSIAVCKRLFPSVNLLKTERCRTAHDGMAEALLMAEYARRKMGHG